MKNGLYNTITCSFRLALTNSNTFQVSIKFLNSSRVEMFEMVKIGENQSKMAIFTP